jgi:hypothetical protein
MLVEIRGNIVNLPDPVARLLLEEGRANLPETATLSPSDGSVMPRGRRQGTAGKRRKS